MRLTLAFTVLGLAVSHVAGQQWQDFGAMPELAKRPFYDAVARRPSLAKRDGGCAENEHPCSDINATDTCCGNTEACIINETTLKPQCCPLGSTCGGTCSPDSYYSAITSTQTASGSTSVETVFACVGRPCTSTNYLCPQSMGGNCCAYGANCASSGQCLVPSTSSSSTDGPAVATMIPSGCSRQGDTACTMSGASGVAGCCGVGYGCATVSSSAVCTQTPSSSSSAGPAPTGSGISVVSPSQGLSTGAKAGIAVGVVVAAALAIGGLTWLCIRRRRSSRSTTTGNELASGGGFGGAGGRNGGLAAAGRHESDDGGLRAYGPSSGPHMSEADGYAASASAHGGGAGPLRGLTSDYFGPVAAAGPYTTATTPEYHEAGTGGAGGPSPDYLARAVRGGGGTPHGPDDIASAVEIGSGKGKDGDVGGALVRPELPSERGSDQGSELDGSDNMLARRQQSTRQGLSSPAVRDSIAGRFELYGTDVAAAGGGGVVDTRAPRPLGTPGSEMTASELGTPSPMSHEEQQQQQQQKSGRRLGS
ncbi:hypothetical protein N8I77_002715 [Diaporthe amygdali]|uniref:Uncharacterized protein n=1 Tax=Phomopsis amygdali TaxID=1214568 RepID=A0AAD9SVC6_PHOAM|nr:hypothetical protein N8I77_002715 [Diaporthe amygdali]